MEGHISCRLSVWQSAQLAEYLIRIYQSTSREFQNPPEPETGGLRWFDPWIPQTGLVYRLLHHFAYSITSFYMSEFQVPTSDIILLEAELRRNQKGLQVNFKSRFPRRQESGLTVQSNEQGTVQEKCWAWPLLLYSSTKARQSPSVRTGSSLDLGSRSAMAVCVGITQTAAGMPLAGLGTWGGQSAYDNRSRLSRCRTTDLSVNLDFRGARRADLSVFRHVDMPGPRMWWYGSSPGNKYTRDWDGSTARVHGWATWNPHHTGLFGWYLSFMFLLQ